MNKCPFDHASHAFGNTYAAQKVVAGAYDLYKNLDPTKLIKGTMKVRVLFFILTLSAFNFSCFLHSAFCAFSSQRQAWIVHGARWLEDPQTVLGSSSHSRRKLRLSAIQFSTGCRQ